MRVLIKLWPILIVFLLWTVGLQGGWWDFIYPTFRDRSAIKPGPIQPSIVINETKLVGWEAQRRKWEVEAKRIWQRANGFEVYFEQISKGVIFSVKDRRVDFKAGWVRWEKLKNKMFIGGGMQALIDKGCFKTSEAIMDYDRQELFCPKPIVYNEPNLFIKADSMQVDLEKEEFLLQGNVELVQNKDRVRAKALIYNLKEEKYHLVEPGGITLNL